jgi:hypothetical protein
MLASTKHEVLEKMRESGLTQFFILLTDVVPHVDRHDGRFVIHMHDHREAVIQHERSYGISISFAGAVVWAALVCPELGCAEPPITRAMTIRIKTANFVHIINLPRLFGEIGNRLRRFV